MNKLAISPLPAPFVTVIPIGLVIKVLFPIFTDKDGIFNFPALLGSNVQLRLRELVIAPLIH
jgi:hypothetical protein